MYTLSTVKPSQRRVRAEMDAWANGRRTRAIKLVTVSPIKSRELSRRMAAAMMSIDGPLVCADD